MKTDNVVRVEAMNILLRHLGPADTERFIAIVNRDKFNYTDETLFIFVNYENKIMLIFLT